MSDREKKLLLWLIPAVLVFVILQFFVLKDDKPAVVGQAPGQPVSGETVAQAEKRLAKLRTIAATVPAKQKVLDTVDADLAVREKAVIQVDTAAQAQARLLEIANRVAKAEGIDLRGGEFGQPKVLSADYGEVFAVVSFACPIEKYVNFMSGLSHEPDLIGPTEIHISSNMNPKDKLVNVRMTIGGLVPKKLIPEKKGFSF
jgi:hypothetical protein